MIDAKTQAELRQRFNPEGSDLRKMQLRMLEMLKFIDEVCQKHNIQYWLSSGTCLGAVRHGGFIPWDDDVDIEMERKEYIKLIKILQEDKSLPYILQTTKTDKHYVSTYAKLRDTKSVIDEYGNEDLEYKGCFIDIFPLERSNAFALKITALLQCYMLHFVRQQKWIPMFCRQIWLRSMIFLLHNIIFPVFRLINYPFTDPNILHHAYGMGFLKERKKDEIFPLKQILFEGDYFFVPGKTEKYLNRIYPDYESIPDLDKIHVHTQHVRFID